MPSCVVPTCKNAAGTTKKQDGITFHLSAKGSVKEYYTLECLLYFLKNIHLIHPEYCKQAAAANIMAVWRPDRKKLLAYLNGETDTYAFIDKSAKLPIPTRIKHTQDEESGESAVKRPRIEKNPEEKVKEEFPVSCEAQGDIGHS